jgi:hypothetical protein
LPFTTQTKPGPAQERAFRLHILGAVDSEEVHRLPWSMGELGKLLVPHYYKGGLEGALWRPYVVLSPNKN